MNELEQRIYRDATRAAAEVTAADVPPLRLPPRSGMAWSGLPRGPLSKRVLAPAAAAASVAALIVTMIVVGHGSPGNARHQHPPTAPGKHATTDPAIGAKALDWYFPASGATYTNGLAFRWTQNKITARDTDSCLGRAGFGQPPFRQSRRLYQLSFPDNSEFPDLAQLAAHPVPHISVQQYPVLRHPTSARQKAFARALARCTARYAQPVTRVDQAAGPLQTRWLNIVTVIEHSPQVSATQPAFARCLEARGVPASLATRTDNTASNPLFYGYFSWADGLNQTSSGNAQYTADVRHEVRVFVPCAQPVLSVLEKIQLTRRTQFFREHARQIARIVRLARKMAG